MEAVIIARHCHFILHQVPFTIKYILKNMLLMPG